jgi:hypothetical protein
LSNDERDEIAAAVAARDDLGPRYDSAIAESLVDRIGDEIDRRVEARLRSPHTPAPHAPAASGRSNYGISGVFLGLGSMGIGIGATAVVTINAHNGFAQVVLVVLIWAAIAVVNVAHARRR